MTFDLFLAHGALGIFDELVFLAVAVVFVGMMISSWVRARGMEDNALETPAPADVLLPQEPTTDAPSVRLE